MAETPDPKFVLDYERAFYAVGLARRAEQAIEDAIRTLKLQLKAAQADVRVKEHAFTEFILAHGDEVGNFTEWRAEQHTADKAEAARVD